MYLLSMVSSTQRTLELRRPSPFWHYLADVLVQKISSFISISCPHNSISLIPLVTILSIVIIPALLPSILLECPTIIHLLLSHLLLVGGHHLTAAAVVTADLLE